MAVTKSTDETLSTGTVYDPELPAEVDLRKGRRGAHLPSDPAERASALERRVILLQKHGARLRQAAEDVYLSAVKGKGDSHTIDSAALEALRRALYEME